MQIRTARPADEAQWQGLWRGYTEFYETHSRGCHRRHLATDRRAGARDPVPVRRARGVTAGLLPFAATRGNPCSGAHMLSGGSVRRSRRLRARRRARADRRSCRVGGSIGQGLSGFAGAARALEKHKVLVVELHHRENERRADTEQQHAVGRLQRAHHPPTRLERHPDAPRVAIESTE